MLYENLRKTKDDINSKKGKSKGEEECKEVEEVNEIGEVGEIEETIEEEIENILSEITQEESTEKEIENILSEITREGDKDNLEVNEIIDNEVKRILSRLSLEEEKVSAFLSYLREEPVTQSKQLLIARSFLRMGVNPFVKVGLVSTSPFKEMCVRGVNVVIKEMMKHIAGREKDFEEVLKGPYKMRVEKIRENGVKIIEESYNNTLMHCVCNAKRARKSVVKTLLVNGAYKYLLETNDLDKIALDYCKQKGIDKILREATEGSEKLIVDYTTDDKMDKDNLEVNEDGSIIDNEVESILSRTSREEEKVIAFLSYLREEPVTQSKQLLITKSFLRRGVNPFVKIGLVSTSPFKEMCVRGVNVVIKEMMKHIAGREKDFEEVLKGPYEMRVEKIRENGVREFEESYNNTLMHCVCNTRGPKKSVVEILLKNGADKYVLETNNLSKIALDYCEQNIVGEILRKASIESEELMDDFITNDGMNIDDYITNDEMDKDNLEVNEDGINEIIDKKVKSILSSTILEEEKVRAFLSYLRKGPVTQSKKLLIARSFLRRGVNPFVKVGTLCNSPFKEMCIRGVNVVIEEMMKHIDGREKDFEEVLKGPYIMKTVKVRKDGIRAFERSYNNTLMHCVCKTRGHNEFVVETLLNNGADKYILKTNNLKKTALEYCEEERVYEILMNFTMEIIKAENYKKEGSLYKESSEQDKEVDEIRIEKKRKMSMECLLNMDVSNKRRKSISEISK